MYVVVVHVVGALPSGNKSTKTKPCEWGSNNQGFHPCTWRAGGSSLHTAMSCTLQRKLDRVWSQAARSEGGGTVTSDKASSLNPQPSTLIPQPL